MGTLRLDRVLDFLTGTGLLVGLLQLGLLAFTISTFILILTRWGDSQPLFKCLTLSLLGHLLLAGFASMWVPNSPVPMLYEKVFNVALSEPATASEAASPDLSDNVDRSAVAKDQPWEQFLHEAVSNPAAEVADREAPALLADPNRQSLTQLGQLPDAPALDHVALAEVKPADPRPIGPEGSRGRPASDKEAEKIEAPAAQRRDAPRLNLPVGEAAGMRGSPEGTLSIERVSTAPMPKALLEQFGPLPRLADSPTVVDAGDALSAAADQAARPSRGGPADAVASGDVGTATGRGSTTGSGTGPVDASYSATAVQRMQPSSIAGLPGRTGTGGGSPSSAGGIGSSGNGPGGGLAGTGPGVVGGVSLVGPPQLPSGRREGDHNIPNPYRLRVAPDRAKIAQLQGATPETEAAVKAALKWLSESQAKDGRWDASEFGSGREDQVLGRNRQNTGIEADTGVTGLALLAMLASGHTHREGEHRESVRRGLEFLMRSQAADGNLGGQADYFARQYCHAMATIALSEAFGMTGDNRLRQPVRRALDCTLAAQNTTTGGWRYLPNDPGDTSQFGWQWMALKSGDMAGFPIPDATRQGAIKYLRSVASGKSGGLAAYRPGEQPSRTMTAESLFCWQLLGLPRENPAVAEAANFILGELPGGAKHNCYGCYYATLALYQLQGDPWQRWNEAMQTTLVQRQRKTGPEAGSWDTDSVWGGYGGRVYTTAISTLALEVYYRFLPLYGGAAGKVDSQ